MAGEYILEMNGITKRYGSNAVLKNVTLQIRPGEIHALLGENGAGKSTLMNVLFGMPVIHGTGGFEGEVRVDGEKAKIMSPMDAMNKGIGMVHQEFMLIPGFNIAENIKLNREISKPWMGSRMTSREMEILNTSAMSADARKALDAVGIGIDEYSLVGGLPVGYMQFVEIAREIDKKGMKVMVFDEPTAVLTESEAEQLIGVMKSIAAQGIAIIFITHRLDEVMNACDRITILRDGQLVTTLDKTATSVEEIAALMIGRGDEGVIRISGKTNQATDNVALSVRGLSVAMPGESVHGIDLDVYEGEILGIGGLVGAGRSETIGAIFGQYNKGVTKEVYIKGQKVNIKSPADAIKLGIGMITEERKLTGIVPMMSIRENIALASLPKLSGKVFINKKKIYEEAKKQFDYLKIKAPSMETKVYTLSGGNQQKVILGKWLTAAPEILFVDEPTKGIDVGTKADFYTLLGELASQGVAIVMVSSDMPELVSMSDRCLVLSEGRLTAELKKGEITDKNVMKAAIL